MADYLLLFIGTVLVNNFVLVKFLGLCPFMGVSKKLETAMGMGLATTFVMTLASICAWLIDTWILIPLNLVYLRTLAFILVIAVVVQFTEMVVRKTSPALYRLLGIFLPLIRVISISHTIRDLPRLSIVSVLSTRMSLSSAVPVVVLVPTGDASVVLMSSG